MKPPARRPRRVRCRVCGGVLRRLWSDLCPACVKAHFWRCESCLELVPNAERESHHCDAGRQMTIEEFSDDLPF